MKRLVLGIIGLALATGPLALAREPASRVTRPAPADQEDDVDDTEIEGVGGRQLPELDLPATEVDREVIEQALDREHPAAVYRGAEQLGMDVELVAGIRQGLDLLFHRDYKGTRDHFEQIEAQYPNTALASVANTLVWQAMMLENFDFRFDDQYRVSSAQARKDLEAALALPGNEGWEHFLMSGVVGIEAIHSMRLEKYLPALQLAFEAMDHAQRAKAAVPEFVDLLLADGMYNYWRTVVTMSTPILPDFGDQRAQGIAQMQQVENAGVFLAPPTKLALAFTWMEERKNREALNATLANKRAYPDNVVNNLVLGQVQTRLRRFDMALSNYDHVLQVAPNNNRVHYWRGVTLLRAGRADEATQALERYLASDHLEPWQQASAHFRLGQVHYRSKRYADAFDAHKQAVKINGFKPSKAAMDRMKKARREGRISW